MPDQQRGTDRAGRRAKRFFSPSQKYEVFIQLVRQEMTMAEAAEHWQVDREIIMRIRRVAKEGALEALSAPVRGQGQGAGPRAGRRLALASTQVQRGEVHAGIGYVCPMTSTRDGVRLSARPGRRGSRKRGCDDSPTIDRSARQHRPGDPTMSSSRTGIYSEVRSTSPTAKGCSVRRQRVEHHTSSRMDTEPSLCNLHLR